VTHPFPKQYLSEHILKGDRSDGVPNILSPDDTFTENNEDGSKIETDGSSGYFLGIKFPIGVDSDSCKMLSSD